MNIIVCGFRVYNHYQYATLYNLFNVCNQSNQEYGSFTKKKQTNKKKKKHIYNIKKVCAKICFRIKSVTCKCACTLCRQNCLCRLQKQNTQVNVTSSVAAPVAERLRALIFFITQPSHRCVWGGFETRSAHM